jgi:hypothetical protein
VVLISGEKKKQCVELGEQKRDSRRRRNHITNLEGPATYTSPIVDSHYRALQEMVPFG